MSIENVRNHFNKFGAQSRIIEFDSSSATVALAALALGCEEREIAKTLSFELDLGCIVIVAAGDAKVDNQKFKAAFNTKAKMLSAENVNELTGHEVGGVCPFALKAGVKIYLDESLKRFDFVYPACGSTNSAIKLTLPELEQFSGYTKWVDVCKNWQE